VEALVEKLQLPAYVMYLGAQQHAQVSKTYFGDKTRVTG
jgi:hypothetical protein